MEPINDTNYHVYFAKLTSRKDVRALPLPYKRVYYMTYERGGFGRWWCNGGCGIECGGICDCLDDTLHICCECGKFCGYYNGINDCDCPPYDPNADAAEEENTTVTIITSTTEVTAAPLTIVV